MKNQFLLFAGLLCVNIFTKAQTIETLTLQPGPEGYDAYFNSAYIYQNTTWGNSTHFAALAYTFGGDYGIGRSVISFDFSSIPADAFIINAQISLFYPGANSYGVQTGDNACYLQRVTSNWDEQTVTWNSQTTYTTENQVVLPTSTDPYQDYPNIDVTALVADMLAPGNNNYGFVLNMIGEDPYRLMVFATGDNPDVSLRPKLVVIYQTCLNAVASYSYAVDNDLAVIFNNQSMNANSFYWDFGDGYFSNLQNPQHAYQSQGIYHVCLIAGSECGNDTICQDVSNCKTLKSGFSFNNENDRLLVFADSSLNAENWHWNFGDGFYSDLENPTHYFNNYGTYSVCLTVVNICYSDTCCKNVQVGPNAVAEKSTGSFTVYPNPSCTGFTIGTIKSEKQFLVRLVDMTGKVIFSRLILPSDGRLFVSPLKPGVYTLISESEQGNAQTKLIAY